MSTTPVSSNETALRAELNEIFRYYEVPEQMLHYGLILLDRVIDINATTSRQLVLREGGSHHYVHNRSSCTNMVYLLLKHLFDNNQHGQNPLAVHSFTRVYGGQTINFRNRENARGTHIMRDSGIKICLGHGMTSLQMDCLESTVVAFIFAKYGLRTTNRTIYPKYVYPSIPLDVNIDDTDSHSDPRDHGINTWRLIQRAMIIGTGPPQTLLQNPNYQADLRVWNAERARGAMLWNPLLDWEMQSQQSRNIRQLLDLIASDDAELPPFINHFHDVLSANLRDLAQSVSPDSVRAADSDVQVSILNLRKDVIIMFGARPTFLYAANQSRHYFAELEKISPKTVGISEELAYDILDQLAVHPTSIQLERLLKDLTAIWITPAGREFNNVPVHDYQDIQNLELYPVKDETEICTLPKDPEHYLLPDNISQQLPTISLAEMMHSWLLNNQVSYTNRAIKMVPNFHALPEAQKVKHMKNIAQREGERMRLAWMERFINSGLFVPSPGEDRRSQMQRFWKQINLQRMKRGLNPDAVPYTCCWCGQMAARVTQAGTNKVNFGTRQDGCPNGPVHTSGWGALIGNFEDMFPEGNIFVAFFNYLPDNIVINNWQLVISFAEFLYHNQWHPQAFVLYDRFRRVFPIMNTFRSAAEVAGVISTYMDSLNNAMGKLGRQGLDVVMCTRPASKMEKDWSEGFKGDKTLFAIRANGIQPDVLVNLEDTTYMDYARALNSKSSVTLFFS